MLDRVRDDDRNSRRIVGTQHCSTYPPSPPDLPGKRTSAGMAAESHSPRRSSYRWIQPHAAADGEIVTASPTEVKLRGCHVASAPAKFPPAVYCSRHAANLGPWGTGRSITTNPQPVLPRTVSRSAVTTAATTQADRDFSAGGACARPRPAARRVRLGTSRWSGQGHPECPQRVPSPAPREPA